MCTKKDEAIFEELLKNSFPDREKKICSEHIVSELYIPQDPFDKLWMSCVHHRVSLSAVGERLDYSWSSLLRNGFNRNFLTRKRWLNIEVLCVRFGVNGDRIIKELGVTQEQLKSWNLTPKEQYLLQIVLLV